MTNPRLGNRRVSKPCPVPECETRVCTKYLMCPFHWARVPRPLQAAVYRAFRAWFDEDLATSSYAAYRAAADAAISAAEKGPDERNPH